MSPGILAFINGIYVVPIALLAWGHKIRRLSPRSRRAFWCAIIGHCIAGTVAVIWGMIPPEAWTEEETARGFFGLWAMLLLPIAGGIGGALTATDTR